MKNAFAKYRDKNKLSWKDMADRCDLHISQVGYILKMTPGQLGRINLETASRIKLAIGIDLFESVTDSVREFNKKEKDKRSEVRSQILSSEMAGGQVDKSVAEQDALA